MDDEVSVAMRTLSICSGREGRYFKDRNWSSVKEVIGGTLNGAVSSFIFGFVQGEIGNFNQVCCILHMGNVKFRNSTTYGLLKPFTFGLEFLAGHLFANSFGDMQGSLYPGFRQDQEKFLSTISGGYVIGPAKFFHNGGKFQ